MATLHQPQRRCTGELQSLMSDKDVDTALLVGPPGVIWLQLAVHHGEGGFERVTVS